MALRPRAQSESGDCTWVPHGDGLQPPIALSPTFLPRCCRSLSLVGRRVCVATALVLFTLALSSVVAAQTQRQALEALYDATDGPNWRNSTNWRSTAPLNDWHGVFTDASGNVTDLLLDYNELSGLIPAELGNLTNLWHLSLRGNQLSGEIPYALGYLSNLSRLDLGNNELSGPIPAELGNLRNLQHLSLRGNQLSGEIPTALGNLSELFPGSTSTATTS